MGSVRERTGRAAHSRPLRPASLKSLGVEMKTQVIEWAAFQERTRKHEFQAQMAGWGTGVDPDLNWNLWHTEMADQEGGRRRRAVRLDRRLRTRLRRRRGVLGWKGGAHRERPGEAEDDRHERE